MAAVKDVVFRIVPKTKEARAALQKLANDSSKFKTRVDEGTKSVNQLGVAAKRVGQIFGTLFVFNEARKALNTIQDFEQSMANLQAVANASAEEIKLLEDNAKKLGATTSFTAEEVSALSLEYAKLGFSTQEILNATEATLALAAATGTDLASAAEITGNTIRAFNLDASETGRVVNVMAASFSSSGLDIEKFRESMKLVAPIASAAGVSVETTTALLGKLADAGIAGSLAGTALRNLLGKLSDSNSDLSKSLGFSVKNSEDLIKAFETLKEKNIDLTEATELSDERSKAAFITLVNNADAIKNLAVEITGTNEAQRQQEERLKTLSGQLTILKSVWDGLILTLNENNRLTHTLSGAVEFLQVNIKDIIKAVGVLTTAFVTYKAVAIAADLRTKALAFSQKVLATESALAARGVTGTAGSIRALTAAIASNPIGLLVSVVTAAASAFFLFRDNADEATESLEEFNQQSLTAADRLFESLIENVLGTKSGLDRFREGIKDLKREELGTLLSKLNSELLEAKKNFEPTGKPFIDDPKIAQIKEFEEAIKIVNTEIEIFNKLQNEGSEAQEENLNTLKFLSEQVKKYKEELTKADIGSGEFQKTIEDLAKAELALAKATKEATDEIERQKSPLGETKEEEKARKKSEEDANKFYDKIIKGRKDFDSKLEKLQVDGIADEFERDRAAALAKRDAEVDDILNSNLRRDQEDAGIKAADAKLKRELAEIDNKEKDKREKAEADLAAKKKKKDEDTLNDTIEAINITTAALSEAIGFRLQALDREIAQQQDRVNRAADLADEGNSKLVEAEQRKLDQLQAQQERFVRQQQVLSLISFAANSAVAIAKTAADSGVLAPITIAATLAAIIGGVASAAAIFKPQGFAEGTEFIEGRGSGTSDDIPAYLSRGERVVTAKKNKEYFSALSAIHNGTVPADDINSFVENYGNFQRNLGDVMLYDSGNDLSTLEGRLESIEKAILKKGGSSVSINERGIFAIVDKISYKKERLDKSF